MVGETWEGVKAELVVRVDFKLVPIEVTEAIEELLEIGVNGVSRVHSCRILVRYERIVSSTGRKYGGGRASESGDWVELTLFGTSDMVNAGIVGV